MSNTFTPNRLFKTPVRLWCYGHSGKPGCGRRRGQQGVIGSRINRIAAADAGRAIEYRADVAIEEVSGAEDYMARGDAPRNWSGSGAVAARLEDPMDLDQCKLINAARDPITGDRLGRITPQTGALEFSIAPPKSVSVLAALTAAMGDEETNRVIDEALKAAADAAVATAEDLGGDLSRSHTGVGADRRMVWLRTDGLIASVFAHETNFAGDPHKHRHIVIANRVCRTDGQWVSPDTRAVFAAKGAMVAVAGAVFNQHLVEQLGVVLTDEGEIAGVPDDLIELFSSRNAEVQSALAEWIQQQEAKGETLSKRQKLDAAERFATTTRSAPQDPVQETTSQRLDRWLAEASAKLGVEPDEINLGPSPDEVAAQQQRLESWAWPPSGSFTAAVTEARDQLDAVMNSKAVWRRRQLLSQAAKVVPPGADPRWVSWLCDDALNRAVTIIEPVLPPGAPMEQTVDPNAKVYQAQEVWHAEQEIDRAAKAGQDAGRAVAETYQGWATDLSEDQQAAVNDICSSGDTISTVVGAAGTGKTTMMRAAAERWSRAGYTVTGIAVAAQAAKTLRDQANLTESRTVAGILRGRAGPPPPGVWIIDEAGMMGTVDLAAIVAAAAESESKIVMVGDPKQLPAIDAGGMFRLLTERLDTSELDTGWRFTENWEYDNSRRLRAGDPTAIDTLNDHERIHAAANQSDTVAKVVEQHRDALNSGQTFIATAHTRDEVHTLNMALRQNLELGPELLRLHRTDLNVDTPIATGDIIITGRNDPNLAASDGATVRNGVQWRVLGLHRNHLHVERLDTPDTPGVTALLPQRYIHGANPDGRPWIEHANATTIHRAQGKTFDHAVAVASARTNCSQLYVQQTRGRHANHVIVAGAGDRNQAVAVLHTVLDQLIDDKTGIEHSETPPVRAAAREEQWPEPFLDFIAMAKATFPTITDEAFAETYKAAMNKDTPENRQRLWYKLQELHDPEPPPLEPLEELHDPEPPPLEPLQELHDPEPPPLDPSDFDISL